MSDRMALPTMLKILNVTVSLNPKGGGWPERTIQMSRALASTGAECRILTFDEGFAYDIEGVRITALATVAKGKKLAWVLPPGSLGIIKAQVASVDVVHLMGFRSLLNAMVYRYAKSMGKPVIICPAGSLPSYGGRANQFLKRIFDFMIGNTMVRHVNACIAITEKEKETLIRHGFSRERVFVLENAVCKQDFLQQDDTGFRAGFKLGQTKFILYLGRLTPIKGPDLLLQAFAREKDKLKDYHLVFAGPDAGMQKELEAMVKDLAIETRVHFIGHLAQPDKSHAYHAAELLVVPSRQEAMSIVALECGICATPVLLTDACGFDCITEVDKRLVVKTSIEGLAEGMVNLLCSEGDLTDKGQLLKAFIEDKYTWEATVGRYIMLYEKLVAE